ncbi:hypothetical protein CQW23_05963 [Capsicum baccatum]|uniref:Uncharacterized protein n=1 Tax=Capsicum baccatum TaxID=33114 RepID=A0A2G2X234_CAPBA|nr:hypothetical protein CQW23_05963 [Capsicum baccatum]
MPRGFVSICWGMPRSILYLEDVRDEGPRHRVKHGSVVRGIALQANRAESLPEDLTPNSKKPDWGLRILLIQAFDFLRPERPASNLGNRAYFRPGMGWIGSFSAAPTSSHCEGQSILDERKLRAHVLAIDVGHVNPSKASTPGLIYDIHSMNYTQYLCGLSYTKIQIGLIGNGESYEGQSLFQQKYLPPILFPLVYSQEIAKCEPESLKNADVRSKIVSCDNDKKPPNYHDQVVKDVGGVAIIFVNPKDSGDTILKIVHVLPATIVGSADEEMIKGYVTSSSTTSTGIIFDKDRL